MQRQETGPSLLTEPAQVAPLLLEYLKGRLGVHGLHYAQPPSLIPDGWETYIYRFQLQGEGLSSPQAGPLILRLYSSIHGLPRLRHEFAAQECMRRLGYPVADPLLLEDNDALFGGPFMIMELLPGRTLLALLKRQPWRIHGGPASMGIFQARLHQLPVTDFPAPPGPFLTRHLDAMQAIIQEFDLAGLKPGLDWLCSHRPGLPEFPSIVHLDFHPLNFMIHKGQPTGVLDWGESDVGDRHADVATSIVLMMSTPVPLTKLWHKILDFPARYFLRRGYRNAYLEHLPLDPPTLAYYMAWAAFRRLCNYGRWLCAGPQITGSKPSILHYLRPESVAVLQDCFREWAGVEVHLPMVHGT